LLEVQLDMRSQPKRTADKRATGRDSYLAAACEKAGVNGALNRHGITVDSVSLRPEIPHVVQMNQSLRRYCFSLEFAQATFSSL